MNGFLNRYCMNSCMNVSWKSDHLAEILRCYPVTQNVTHKQTDSTQIQLKLSYDRMLRWGTLNFHVFINSPSLTVHCGSFWVLCTCSPKIIQNFGMSKVSRGWGRGGRGWVRQEFSGHFFTASLQFYDCYNTPKVLTSLTKKGTKQVFQKNEEGSGKWSE